MMNEKMCPVCGFEMSDGPRDYNICPSCGTEFGLHDVNSSIEVLRDVWIESGPRWYSRVVAEPVGLNPWLQLLRLFLSVQTAQNINKQAIVPYSHTIRKRSQH